MIHVYFATSNKGKLRELMEIFSGLFGDQFVLHGRAPTNCEETADSFSGNAAIKADALARELVAEGAAPYEKPDEAWVIADDSGLCVEALGGDPGVRSARYAGDHVDSSEHMQKLLSELARSGKPRPWKANYHCALAMRVLTGNRVVARFEGEGRCHGEIVPEARGGSGFGYDPLFVLGETGLRFSELPEPERNRRSHRMSAFISLKMKLSANRLA